MKNESYLISNSNIFIKRLFINGILLVLISLITANVNAASIQPNEFDITDSTVYLPLILNNFYIDPSIPKLESPQNGAELDTLIPNFVWDIGVQPDDAIGCLALSTNPNPLSCRISFLLGYFSDWLIGYNLEPDTVYFWRIGVIYDNDYDNPKWSEEWSFTTGAPGGPIVAAPILQSPADNSTVSTSLVTLSWLPTTDAIEYNLRIHSLDENSWFGFNYFTTTHYDLDLGFFSQIYGNNFEWIVTARNDYAWGPASELWSFTYDPASSSIGISSTYENIYLIEEQGKQFIQIR